MRLSLELARAAGAHLGIHSRNPLFSWVESGFRVTISFVTISLQAQYVVRLATVVGLGEQPLARRLVHLPEEQTCPCSTVAGGVRPRGAGGRLCSRRPRTAATSASSRTSPWRRTARPPSSSSSPAPRTTTTTTALHYLNTEQFDKVERAHRPVARAARPDRPADRDPDPPRPAHLREEPREDARLPPQPARAALRPPEGDARRRPEPADRARPEAHRPRHPPRLVRSPAGGTSTTSRTPPSTGWPPRRPRLGQAPRTCSSGSSGRTSPTCRSWSSTT